MMISNFKIRQQFGTRINRIRNFFIYSIFRHECFERYLLFDKSYRIEGVNHITNYQKGAVIFRAGKGEKELHGVIKSNWWGN